MGAVLACRGGRAVYGVLGALLAVPDWKPFRFPMWPEPSCVVVRD